MTQSPYPTPFAALADWAARSGPREALAFPLAGARMTFAEWHADAAALARGLLARGIRPGDPVALLAENRIEWPLVQLAAAACGAVLVPLNTHYRSDDLADALGRSRARALVLSPRFRTNAYRDMVAALRPQLPDLALVVSLDEAGPGEESLSGLLAEGRAATLALPEVSPTAPASLQYTSGTTGRPKGALLHHLGMLENAWQTGRRLGFGAGDRYTSIIPLFHCAGCIMGVLTCLQYGATYVGVPGFDSETMFRVIEGERCTALSGVPTSYLAMLDHPARAAYDLSSLRTGTCGGADCNPEVLARCARDFPMPELVQVYGQTESSTLVAMAGHRDPDRVRDAGHALDGYAIRITHPETGAPQAAGTIGQIEARGPMTMIGYHDDPAATAETIDAEGWLRTGDLGFLDEAGRLTIAGGRLRDMIIRGGENIYPAEAENTLGQHPAVAEAAVFGVPDAYYGEIVGAALRLREPAAGAEPAGSADLAAHCAARIARFKVPVRWFRVEAFPLTSSGKIRKVELRARVANGQLEELP